MLILRYKIFLLLMLLGAGAYSQQVAVVYGKLTDKNGKPAEDITISLFGKSYPPAFTNKQGEFEYNVPANENIIVVLSGINFSQEKITVNLKPGERYFIERKLKDAEGSVLDSVVIEDKHLRAVNMVRLDPKVVGYIPSPSGDFNSILFSQLGVSNRNELSSQYSVRGGNFDENLVYVNDIEVYRPFLVRSGQQEGLSFINSEMVSSILFSAGGFEAKYGDKMSSVLDVQYRRPRKFAGSALAGLQGSNIHLEGASKDFRFTWIMGARYKTQRRVLGAADTEADYRPWFADFQTFMTYDLSDVWEVNILGNYARNKFIVVPQTRETSFGTINKALQLKVYFDGAEIDDFETYTGAVSFNYHPHDNLRMKFITSAFRTFENETFDIQGQYYIDELERDIGKDNFGQSIATLGVGTFLNHARNYLNASVYTAEHKGTYERSKQRLLWGLRFQTEQVNDKLSEWKMIDSAGYSLPQAHPDVIQLQEVVKTKRILTSNRAMSYVQYVFSKELKDTSEFTLTAGVRANYWDLNGQTVVSPRITLAYKPYWKRDFLFKASGGYYYQPPFYRELRNLYGEINTGIKAQQSIHFLVSADHNFKAWNRPFKFITEAYYKSLNMLIPYEVDNVRIRYYAENSAVGYATGLDMKVNGEFIKGIESWASLSVMQTKEDILNDYYYDYYNKSGEKIIAGYTLDTKKADSILHEPGFIPRPTDQRVSFSIFFQDYLPRFPDFKMHLNLLFGTSIPFGPPDFAKYKDTLKMPPYRRVDIGFSYQVVKESKPLPASNPFHNLKSLWVSLEVFNLLDVNNTVSYLWIKDIANRQYAIPNYLTGRILNLRTIARF